MQYTFILATFLAAGFPAGVFAETFMPPAQDPSVELGLEALMQEAPGLRFGIAYVMNMGMPSLVSKIGVDGGLYSFDGVSMPAPEYGFFWESTVFAAPSYTAVMKTGLYTLAFPESVPAHTSISTVAIEPSVQWKVNDVFWEIGIGARYWDSDSKRIEVGKVTLEKTWLFYPKIGVSGHF